MGPHISIKGEAIFEIAGFTVTNSIITTVLVIIAFYFIAAWYHSEIQKSNRSLVFYAMHGLIKSMYSLFESVIGSKITIFFTLLASFFFFILLNNWSGLVPGVGSLLVEPAVHAEKPSEELKVEEGKDVILHETESGNLELDDYKKEDKEHHYVPLLRGGTADLNTTFALAILSVLITQFFGFKFLGAKGHFNKYINLKDPISFFVGPLEAITELSRILSFAFRLYGNVFAGEVLLTIIPFLLPIFLSFMVSPIFFLEIFVGFVQALVFAMLTAVFIKMATTAHH